MCIGSKLYGKLNPKYLCKLFWVGFPAKFKTPQLHTHICIFRISKLELSIRSVFTDLEKSSKLIILYLERIMYSEFKTFALCS